MRLHAASNSFLGSIWSQPGERRGGRKKGTPNRISTEIREAARKYAREALQLQWWPGFK